MAVKPGALPLAVFLLYAWLSPWVPALRSPNELSRLYQARAIVEDHSLSVNAQLVRHGPVGDLSLKDGRSYPNKAPGLSLLGAGVYAALRAVHGGPPSEASSIFWLRLALCALPGALAAELLRRILARRFEPPLAAAGALAFALGTLAWPYSTFFMSHGPTTAALVACWWLLDGEASARRWAVAGLLAGTAVLLEYTSALALPPLAVYGWARARGSRPVLAALAGVAPPVAALALYHQLAFGGPLETGYAHLVNPVFAGYHARGFLGVGAPSLRALAGSFFDPARGLFAWAPFLALGVPGLALLARRDRALALLCGAELALYALFTASFTYEAWGWSVGPRHVTPLCAFLTPPALAGAAWLRDRGLGFAAAALALAGIATVALTVAVCPYLPEELTNPVHQLVLPLLRAGLRAPSAPEVALGTRSAWLLAPWLALLAGAAASAALALVRAPPGRRWREPSAALVAAAALLAVGALAGGPDRYDAPRAFMAAQLGAASRP